jgi:peptidoglycan/xylan/chitin deacetylase (PgdA/CDA1 family)
MNEAQLSHMQRNGHHIGSHGHDHYWWNSLSEEELSLELDLSLKFLKRIGVDIDNWTACYPYGSFDDQAINMLEKKGCKLALTTEVNIASINKNNRFVMPRLDTNDIPKDRNAEPNQWYERA